MKQLNTLTDEISKKILVMEKKGFGLGRMFNRIRNLHSCKHLSDLAILRFILCKLGGMGKLPPKNKIGHHFRTKISKEDWKGIPKGQILADLYNPTP